MEVNIMNLSKKGEELSMQLQEEKERVNKAILEKNEYYFSLLMEGRLIKVGNKNKANRRTIKGFEWW